MFLLHGMIALPQKWRKNSAGTYFKNCDENFTLWSPQNHFFDNGMGFFG